MADTTIIRFYVMKQSDEHNRLMFVCKLCEKALETKQRTVILAQDVVMADTLDQLLWDFRADAFLPHALSTDPAAEYALIHITVPPERPLNTDLLINLSLEPHPDIPKSCSRVFEIVSQQNDVLTVTRQRFAEYRDRGYKPETIKL